MQNYSHQGLSLFSVSYEEGDEKLINVDKLNEVDKSVFVKEIISSTIRFSKILSRFDSSDIGL